MNSINKEQKGHNEENLKSKEAVEKIKELVKSAKTCFFCTNLQANRAFSTRPMSVQTVDDEGNLWFLSASDSSHNQEIQANPSVQLLFQGDPHTDFMSLFGQATITRDKNKIKELWEPLAKTWFTGGEDDPRITVIKINPSEGYYWDTKHGKFVAFAKMAVGSILGKTMDDSIEGTLNP